MYAWPGFGPVDRPGQPTSVREGRPGCRTRPSFHKMALPCRGSGCSLRTWPLHRGNTTNLGSRGLDDPEFKRIVDQDLADGQHRNLDPVGRPEFFTTAYFHTPDGLKQEIERAGFSGTTVYGVEGPGLAAAPGVGRPATARADFVRCPLNRDRARADRLQQSPHRGRGQAIGGGQRATPARRQMCTFMTDHLAAGGRINSVRAGVITFVRAPRLRGA